MLVGVPCREAKANKDQLDRLHDTFHNNIYVVSRKDKKEALSMLSLVLEFLNAAHDNKVSEKFKDTEVKLVDSKAAEVLYGVKRRFKD